MEKCNLVQQPSRPNGTSELVFDTCFDGKERVSDAVLLVESFNGTQKQLENTSSICHASYNCAVNAAGNACRDINNNQLAGAGEIIAMAVASTIAIFGLMTCCSKLDKISQRCSQAALFKRSSDSSSTAADPLIPSIQQPDADGKSASYGLEIAAPTA